MVQSKTQKGTVAMMAGFAVSIIAGLAFGIGICAWMFIFLFSGILWVAGIGWIYGERDKFKEQHSKSVEAAAWLFGISALIYTIAILFVVVQTWTFIMSDSGATFTNQQTKMIIDTHIYFGYMFLMATVMLAASRVFAVIELQNRNGKRLTVLAFVAMLAIIIVVSAQNNIYLTDQNTANQKNGNSFFKKDIDSQLSGVYGKSILESPGYLPMGIILPVFSELLFILAYRSCHSRFSKGELKPRTRE